MSAALQRRRSLARTARASVSAMLRLVLAWPAAGARRGAPAAERGEHDPDPARLRRRRRPAGALHAVRAAQGAQEHPDRHRRVHGLPRRARARRGQRRPPAARRLGGRAAAAPAAAAASGGNGESPTRRSRPSDARSIGDTRAQRRARRSRRRDRRALRRAGRRRASPRDAVRNALPTSLIVVLALLAAGAARRPDPVRAPACHRLASAAAVTPRDRARRPYAGARSPSPWAASGERGWPPRSRSRSCCARSSRAAACGSSRRRSSRSPRCSSAPALVRGRVPARAARRRAGAPARRAGRCSRSRCWPPSPPLSIVWSLAPGGLVAGGEPHARLPGGVRRRDRARAARAGALGGAARTASRSAARGVCVWALLTKVFPGALAPDEIVRAPARAVRLLEQRRADGRARRAAAAVARRAPLRARGVVNALAWPALGLLLVCLMLAYSRGALLALGVGLVVWFVVVPLRLRGRRGARRARALLGACPSSLGVRAGRPDRGPRADGRARRRRARARRAARCCCAVLLAAAGLAVGFVTATRAADRAHAPDRGPRRCSPALALVAGRRADRAGRRARRASTGRSRRRLEPAHGPERAHPRQHAGPPDRDLLRARALLGRGVQGPRATASSVGHRRRRATRPSATRFRQTARSTSATRTATSSQTLADLGWVGICRLAAGGARVAVRPRRAPSACAGATAGCRSTPSGSGCCALVTVVIVFGVHSAIDWTWFVPAQRPAGAAVRRAGWPAAGRCGGAWRPVAVPVDDAASRRSRAAGARSVDARRGAESRSRAALVVVLALAASWAAYQPAARRARGRRGARAPRPGRLRARGGDRAERGRPQPAVGRPAVRARRDPAGARPDCRRRGDALEKATEVQPANAEAWRRLGRFRLDVLSEAARRAEGLPGRVLPRSAEPDVVVGPDRGHARRARGRRLVPRRAGDERLAQQRRPAGGRDPDRPRSRRPRARRRARRA